MVPSPRAHLGFTALELMIVVGVIAILAALALPSYQESYIRSEVRDSITLAGFVEQAVSTYYAVHQQLPPDNGSAGLPPADHIVGTYVDSMTVRSGVIDIEFGNNANRAIKGRHLGLRPAIVPGYPQVPIAWICANANVPVNMAAQGTDTTTLTSPQLPIECHAH